MPIGYMSMLNTNVSIWIVVKIEMSVVYKVNKCKSNILIVGIPIYEYNASEEPRITNLDPFKSLEIFDLFHDTLNLE